ncbi:energy transducer TonB [Acetobacter tropicalis]|uniref:energy transducer TonB n=1 Tax=Acetobacter TaxID=434 RepID=UPI001EDADF82|nr:energy transducer TonB [Acetobacter senegalensis]MCG4252376.1 energy transducer TonB [Acetobacter senegalensis]
MAPAPFDPPPSLGRSPQEDEQPALSARPQKQKKAVHTKSWIVSAVAACCGLYMLVMGIAHRPDTSPTQTSASSGSYAFLDDNHKPVLNRVETPRLHAPPEMRDKGISGISIVGCDIGEDGKAHACRIERGTNPYFNRAGMEYMARAVFFPAMEHGKPVTRHFRMRLFFGIKPEQAQSFAKYGPPLFTGGPTLLPYLP